MHENNNNSSGADTVVIALWQQHIDVLVRIGKALKLLWGALTNNNNPPPSSSAEEAAILADVQLLLEEARSLDADDNYDESDYHGQQGRKRRSAGPLLSLVSPPLPQQRAAVHSSDSDDDYDIRLLFGLLCKTLENLSRLLGQIAAEQQEEDANRTTLKNTINDIHHNSNNTKRKTTTTTTSTADDDHDNIDTHQHRHKVLSKLVFDVLDSVVIPNVFTFIIAPMPSAQSQYAATTTMMTIINTFSSSSVAPSYNHSGAGRAEGTLRQLCVPSSMVSLSDWDDVAEHHSLREAMEVAVLESARGHFQNVYGGGPDNNINIPDASSSSSVSASLILLTSLTELLLRLVTVSESIATSFLCESEDGLKRLVQMAEKALDASSSSHHRRQEVLLDHRIQHMTLVCYLLTFFDVLCRVENAGHLLADDDTVGLPRFVAKIIAVPCKGGNRVHIMNNHDGLIGGNIGGGNNSAEVASMVAGIATSQGLALQLLSHLTESCFPSFGPALLMGLLGNGTDDDNNADGTDDNSGVKGTIQRAIITNIMATSPFAEVVEAAMAWLEVCIRKLGAHIVGMTIVDRGGGSAGDDGLLAPASSAWAGDRALALAFFQSMVEQHSVIYAVQEIIQNYLTSPQTQKQYGGGSDEEQRQEEFQRILHAKARCATGAISLLQAVIQCAPWELQIARHVALEHRVLLGLLVAILRRNRMGNEALAMVVDPSGAAAASWDVSMNQFMANLYAVLAVGTLAASCRAGRDAMASLLTTATVMGAGRGASSDSIMAQTLVNLWSDVERYLAITTTTTTTRAGTTARGSGSPSMFTHWHIHDEHGTQIVALEAYRLYCLSSADHQDSSSPSPPPPPSLSALIHVIADHRARDTVGDHLSRRHGRSHPNNATTTKKQQTSQHGVSSPLSLASPHPPPSCGDIGHLFTLQEVTDAERSLLLIRAQQWDEIDHHHGQQQHASNDDSVPLVLYGALHAVFRDAACVLRNGQMHQQQNGGGTNDTMALASNGNKNGIVSTVLGHPVTLSPTPVDGKSGRKQHLTRPAPRLNLTSSSTVPASASPAGGAPSSLTTKLLERASAGHHHKPSPTTNLSASTIEHNRENGQGSALPIDSIAQSIAPSAAASQFTNTMTLVTSLAHHYVGNIVKLRQVETELARQSVGLAGGGRSGQRSRPACGGGSSSKMKNTMVYGCNNTSASSSSLLNGSSSSVNTAARQRGGAMQRRSGSAASNLKQQNDNHCDHHKILFSATAQQSRCWSIRDVTRDDVIPIHIPLSCGGSLYAHANSGGIPTSAAAGGDGRGAHHDDNNGPQPPIGADAVLDPHLGEFDMALLVSALVDLHRRVKAHIASLHASLERCPIQFPTRRCLLNDLYANVYPKLLLYVRGLLWVLQGGGTVTKGEHQEGRAKTMLKQQRRQLEEEEGDLRHSHSYKMAYNHAAGQAIFIFVRGERREEGINAGNLVEVYQMVMSVFGGGQ